ncbi:hypothetical protein F8388_004307 [Cannabis sativa]|uniref:peroxidase n=1 Tax=Cannabis sativa TaxID=3483 RepID=A0A7J6HBJ5_CANSA|nr:hypothetical protein F8388_004307 [Cannabis sativa]
MGLCVNAQLKTKFYSSSCPKAEAIVRSTVQSHMKKDPTVAAGLLRLHFHDCFVQEGSSANVKEIWFDFCNLRTRFGLGEFAIISGLLCKADSSIEKYIGRGDAFVDKYFRDMTVNYAAVKHRFLNSIFKDDVFAFRMVVLYFVTNFLLSKPGRKKVDSGLLHLIGFGEFKIFPWGKVAYDTPLYSLRTVLKEKNKKKVVDETKESDDDFEDVRQPRVDVDKTVRKFGLECLLKEFRKEVDKKFALLEENLKGYNDRKVGEDLTFYFDTKFLELKDLIKDSIANVVPQSNEDEDEDDGGGGGVGSPRNPDDISDDVEPTVKGDGEDAGDVKDGEDCVGGDGDVYKEIKNICEMSVKEVDSQDFDMPNFDIMDSLLGQNEIVAMVEHEALGSDGGNVGGVEGTDEKVSAGTDDGFSESVMAVINQKVDDVCHAYEVKKIMSPYRNDFGSSGSNEKKKKNNVKGLYPFNSGLFDPPHELQQKAFDEWFFVGFKDENNLSFSIFSDSAMLEVNDE